MSRSATASARPGPSRSARAATGRRGSPARRSSPTAGSTRSTRSARCARSTRATAARCGAAASAPTASRDAYGGGVAFDDGRVYATNGLGYVAALDAATGGVAWTGQAGRAAARRADGRRRHRLCDEPGQPDLFAQGRRRHDQLVERRRAGDRRRVRRRLRRRSAQGTVVAGFSSGELNAYRYENGRMVWQDALVADQHLDQRRVACRDIDADPVIDSGQVYRDRPGRPHGRARAHHRPAHVGTEHRRHLDAVGRRRLGVRRHRRGQADRASAATSGKIRWINQLPRYENEKSKKGPIIYVGPVLAGDRLIVAGIERRADQRQSGRRQLPEPDRRRRTASACSRSSPTSRSTSSTTAARLTAYR